MSAHQSLSLTVKNLPLYWRFSEKNLAHPAIPPRYDFQFSYNNELSLFTEKQTPELLNILDNIYQENANIGYMIDGHNLAAGYGGEYLSFLKKVIGPMSGRKIVDVGCGGCLVLENLKKEGAKVLGVDPSPIAKEAAARKNIELMNSYFKKGMLTGFNADAIIQMDVMEHVIDPVTLLQAETMALGPDGVIVINVPNCESSLERGDISMAIHQHVNMFSRHSLATVVEAAGLYVAEMECSKFGSALFCVATANKSKRKYRPIDFSTSATSWEDFFKKSQERIKKFKSFYDRNLIEDVGYFIFQRALPYLSAIGQEPTGRMFDNNTLWHGQFLDGVPSPVENQQDLMNRPTKSLLIFSLSFGDQIKSEIQKSNKITKIYTQSDVYD